MWHEEEKASVETLNAKIELQKAALEKQRKVGI